MTVSLSSTKYSIGLQCGPGDVKITIGPDVALQLNGRKPFLTLHDHESMVHLAREGVDAARWNARLKLSFGHGSSAGNIT